MYKHDTEEPVVPVPLTTYIVKANKKYRFRITNSGIDKPLKVHIDQVSKCQQLRFISGQASTESKKTTIPKMPHHYRLLGSLVYHTMMVISRQAFSESCMLLYSKGHIKRDFQ